MNTEFLTPQVLAAMCKAGAYFICSDEYPGYYVSPEGNVFSARAKRFLRPMRCGAYLAVGLKDRNGNPVRRYVHRLVAELAYGYIPADHEACHNDGNRDNNAIDNIRWDTRSGNAADKKRHGTDTCGERNPMARLTSQQVAEIRARLKAGCVQRRLCDEYGVSPMTISRIARGETWRNA